MNAEQQRDPSAYEIKQLSEVQAEKEPKHSSGPRELVAEITKNIKFRLKTAGIEFKLDRAENVAGNPIRSLDYKVRGPSAVSDLDRGTVRTLQGSINRTNSGKPKDILNEFVARSKKLPAKIAAARKQNVESYNALKKARQDNPTAAQATELKKLFERQVEVSSILKEPDLVNHLDRLSDKVRQIIANLENEKANPLQDTEAEKQQRLNFVNSGGGHYRFTMKDIEQLIAMEQRDRAAEIDNEVTELGKVLDLVKNYQETSGAELEKAA